MVIVALLVENSANSVPVQTTVYNVFKVMSQLLVQEHIVHHVQLAAQLALQACALLALTITASSILNALVLNQIA